MASSGHGPWRPPGDVRGGRPVGGRSTAHVGRDSPYLLVFSPAAQLILTASGDRSGELAWVRYLGSDFLDPVVAGVALGAFLEHVVRKFN